MNLEFCYYSYTDAVQPVTFKLHKFHVQAIHTQYAVTEQQNMKTLVKM